MALLSAKRINLDDFDQSTQLFISEQNDLIANNPIQSAQLSSRTYQLLSTEAKKTPLYSITPQDKKNSFKHNKASKNKNQPASQPGLWEENQPADNQSHHFKPEIEQPKDKLMQLGLDLNSRFYHHNNPLIKDEIKDNNTRLRNLIGLPIARGKDPHVNDNFYKYLVKQIYFYDTLGIFNEYNHAYGQLTPDLETKINQIKTLVQNLLSPDLKRYEKYRLFKEFTKKNQEK